jgi:hypothetical protein
MMIYLPYSDFHRSAKCLSDRHLAEQRSSIREAIYALTIPGVKRPHWTGPWEGHVTQLLHLCDATLRERRRRGRDERGVVPWMLDHHDPLPEWLNDPAYHGNQRMLLLREDPTHYNRMGWR